MSLHYIQFKQNTESSTRNTNQACVSIHTLLSPPPSLCAFFFILISIKNNLLRLQLPNSIFSPQVVSPKCSSRCGKIAAGQMTSHLPAGLSIPFTPSLSSPSLSLSQDQSESQSHLLNSFHLGLSLCGQKLEHSHSKKIKLRCSARIQHHGQHTSTASNWKAVQDP